MFENIKCCGNRYNLEIKPGQCIDLRFTNPPRNNWARSVHSYGTCVKLWSHSNSCTGSASQVLRSGSIYRVGAIQSIGSCQEKSEAKLNLEITSLKLLDENQIINELLTSGQSSTIRTIINANDANVETTATIREAIRFTYAREIITTSMFSDSTTIVTEKQWKIGLNIPLLGNGHLTYSRFAYRSIDLQSIDLRSFDLWSIDLFI